MAAAAAAHAPVPQAMVSPLPRSKQRMRSVVGFTTRTNSALTRWGNSGAFSKAGPISSRSSPSTRSVNTTQCGLPIDTQVTRQVLPAILAGTSMIFSPLSVQGTSWGLNEAGPMSTDTEVTRP